MKLDKIQRYRRAAPFRVPFRLKWDFGAWLHQDALLGLMCLDRPTKTFGKCHNEKIRMLALCVRSLFAGRVATPVGVAVGAGWTRSTSRTDSAVQSRRRQRTISNPHFVLIAQNILVRLAMVALHASSSAQLKIGSLCDRRPRLTRVEARVASRATS